MVEWIDDPPAGVIGLRMSGKLTKDDYTSVLEPAIREAQDAGEVRALFVLDDYDGLEAGAWTEDAKTGLQALRNHKAWKRSALVTDVDWIAKGMRAFSWMVPGKVKVFEPDELEDARAWVAE